MLRDSSEPELIARCEEVKDSRRVRIDMKVLAGDLESANRIGQNLSLSKG